MEEDITDKKILLKNSISPYLLKKDYDSINTLLEHNSIDQILEIHADLYYIRTSNEEELKSFE